MVFTVWDEKSVPSSSSVELKSVSVLSFKVDFIGCDWIIVSIFAFVCIGDASRDVFVFSEIFVKVIAWFSDDCDFLLKFCYDHFFYFCVISDGTYVMVMNFSGNQFVSKI